MHGLAAQQYLARGDPRGRIEKADHGISGHGFARPGFAHHAEDLARRDIVAHMIYRPQDAMPRGDFHDKVADGKDGCIGHRNLGFSASRSQSPSRLIDSASASSVAAGKTRIHHSPENMNSCPMRMSVPSEGLVGGAPTPRNDSVASAMMASASEIVAITSTGLSTLGRIWRSMIENGVRPM